VHNIIMSRNNLDQPDSTSNNEDIDFKVNLGVNLKFSLTATTDLNAALSEVEFSVLEAVKEQLQGLFDIMTVSVQPGQAIGSGEEAYQQFSGSVGFSLSPEVTPGKTADDIKQDIVAQITAAEYKDESGLCLTILLYQDDQSIEL